MVIVISYLSTMMLNVNAYILLLKDTVAKWWKNKTLCFLQETLLSFKDTHRLKMKGCKKILQANGNPKGTEVAYTYIRQNRLSVRVYQERKEVILYG